MYKKMRWNMQNIKRMAILATVALMAFTGCSSSSSKEESKNESTEGETVQTETKTEAKTKKETDDMAETTESTKEYEYDFKGMTDLRTDILTDDQVELALPLDKYVDKNAVADVIRKAKAGEDVTIACIGGSITMGTISSGTSDDKIIKEVGKENYANIFFDWWKKNFPDTKFEFINAGIGATGSYLAVHRVANDVLSKKPDLVLVEFSVNDAGVKHNQTTYENLVREIRRSEGSPAVMLLFMSQTNGSSAITTHQEIGLYYNLPMISYGNMIIKLMANKVYEAGELAGDEVHPTALGHAITGELLWKYLNDIYAHLDEIPAAEPFDQEKAYFTKPKYVDGTILDRLSITPDEMGTFEESKKFDQFPNDWTSSEGEGGLKFTATFRNLGVMYYRITNGKGAKYDVYVDGEKVGTLNSDFKGGWGNYAESEEVYSSDEAKEHKVEFKKSADSAEEVFTVLGLLVTQ